MRLTQPEIIQILRKRTGLNQGELGSRAFDTTVDSGRTKIKNIELGNQLPTVDDLDRIAKSLGVPVEQLQPTSKKEQGYPEDGENGIKISQRVVNLFPDLGEYITMLEKASKIDDHDLIEYLSGRIAVIFQKGPAVDSFSYGTEVTITERRRNRG